MATHEAGHATVAYFVGQTRQLDVLSIVKRRDSLGLLQHSDTEERFTKSSEELHALLQIAMGGMVAEEHWFDEVSTGPASDLAAATAIGAQMIGACGMGNSLISVAAAGNGYLEGSLVDKVLGDKDARAELDTLLMGCCDAAKAIVDRPPRGRRGAARRPARARRARGLRDHRRDRVGPPRPQARRDRRAAPLGHGRRPAPDHRGGAAFPPPRMRNTRRPSRPGDFAACAALAAASWSLVSGPPSRQYRLPPPV